MKTQVFVIGALMMAAVSAHAANEPYVKPVVGKYNCSSDRAYDSDDSTGIKYATEDKVTAEVDNTAVLHVYNHHDEAVFRTTGEALKLNSYRVQVEKYQSDSSDVSDLSVFMSDKKSADNNTIDRVEVGPYREFAFAKPKMGFSMYVYFRQVGSGRSHWTRQYNCIVKQ